MKITNYLIGFLAGVAISAVIGFALMKIDRPSNLSSLSGSYSSNGDFSSGTVHITELIENTKEKEFKIEISVGAMSGCTGEFEGYGKVIENKIEFQNLNGDECRIIIPISDNFEKIEITEDSCLNYHGMNCTFTEKYARDAKFVYFKELDDARKTHPHEVIQNKGINKALIALMGTDYNLLYDRMMVSSETGTIQWDSYCADGVMPGNASTDAAIFCLNFRSGEAQVAIKEQNELKIFAKGKIWSQIENWAKKN